MTGYVQELGRELAASGIAGKRRARILAEIEDHLACDERAELGHPAELAQQFADELGTSLARRAANVGFVSLAVSGICFGLMLLTARAAGITWGGARFHTTLVGIAGGAAAVLAAQVAFAAGLLGVLRSTALRRQLIIPRSEAAIIGRRAGVALGSAIMAMAGLVLLALEVRHAAPWWRWLTVGTGGMSEVCLLAAVPNVALAARVRPAKPGGAGDLLADLGPFSAPFASTRAVAVVVAGAVAAIVTAVGVLGADPFDGAIRGVADGLACLTGFAVLGRYLGLRA